DPRPTLKGGPAMRRSPLLRLEGLVLAVALLTFGAGCGAAATPPPQQPAIEIAPPPPGSAEPATPPTAKGEAPPKTEPAGKPGSRPTALPGTSIRFEGGDGSSQEKAIVILGAKGESDGVAAEYKYLELVYGPKGSAWRPRKQALLSGKGRHF